MFVFGATSVNGTHTDVFQILNTGGTGKAANEQNSNASGGGLFAVRTDGKT
jgi:hypothetical protein